MISPPIIFGRADCVDGIMHIVGLNDININYPVAVDHILSTSKKRARDVMRVICTHIPRLKVVLPKRFDADVWATVAVEPHRDGSEFSHTLGFVFSGEHVLQSRKRLDDGSESKGRLASIGLLTPGSVYFIDNKIEHAAIPVHEDSQELVFLAIDFDLSQITMTLS